jgi:succinate-semialdehyde dehydrogenase/glutarate-semialdehyde dehydrogenase
MAEITTTPVGEVREAVERARKVQPEWAAIGPEGRARAMRQVRHRLYDRLEDVVETVSAESGKSKREALLFEVFAGINLLNYMERVGPRALRPKKIGRVAGPLLFGSSSRIEWRPFGVVGAITPWNYPITNCLLAFVGALHAGNAVVVKPSEVTPASGELIRDIFDPLPSGVFSVIQGGGEVGAALVDAPCDKISFIGSPPTGRKILEAAAKHLTPTVMELGGQDAAIVCEDADLDVASSGIMWGSFFNAGQTCCSVERIFVVDSVADEFEERFLEKARRVRLGEGDIQMGSLTFARQLEIVERQVDDAVKKGASLLVGGPDAGIENVDGTLWYAPTVLSNVTEEMDVVKEESFGPVVTITRVRDEDEAIRRVNEEAPNLTASVWTTSRKRANRVLGDVRAGSMGSNDHGVLPGMAWAPWGGAGESGFGRLNGFLGVQEFAIPTHIAHSLTPRMKKLHWYPNDEAQESALRGITAAVGARDVGAKVAGVKAVLSGLGKAAKSRL